MWVADVKFIATWSGFVYVAFAIDVYELMYYQQFEESSEAA